MAREVVAADEKVEKTYLRRLFEALGFKGVAVLVAVPAAIAASGLLPVDSALVGAVLTLVFVVAAAADTRTDSASSVDTVGVSFVLLLAGYTALLFTETAFDWTYAVGAAGLVLGAVGYEYLLKGGEGGVGELRGADIDPLHLDIVGFVVAEILVVYAVLHATGWGNFADSSVFVVLAYIIYASTVAAFAGYAVITREIVISRTSQEVHAAHMSILKDVGQIRDEELRKKLALNVRRVAECLDGIRLPTDLEDRYGRVPAVISTRNPDARRMDMTTENVVRVADEADLTGYVVQDDGVSIFRNGRLEKYYRQGRYYEDTEGIENRVADAAFYTLEYPTVMNLLEITPGEGGIADPRRAVEDMEDKEVDESAKAGEGLKIGGEEIDVNEMFSITEEIVDESPKEAEAGGTLNVGGDEIDVDELMDRADDVIDELSE